MERFGKGSAVKNYVDSYCVVDLETTGIYVSSARIIEIGAVKVRSNEIVDEFTTLVNPQCSIPADATAVNNISDEMVKGKPVLDEVIDSFINFVGNDVIVGYNIAGYDLNLLYDALQELRGDIFRNNYIDLLHVSRRCLSNVENHKLETICKHYNINTTGEHRALTDCYLTKACYDKLYEEFGTDIFTKKASSNSNKYRGVNYNAETKALQELHILLKDIIEDKVVTLMEFSSVNAWIENHRDLQGIYPFDRVFYALDKVLEDGIVTSDELIELQELFSEFVDPVRCRGCHDEIKTINGKHIVVTGDFEYGSRKEVCDLIESAGGINDRGVKRATDYVVVGARGSDNWKTGKYGGKIQKALELKDNGENVEIIEEKDFIPALKKIIENNNYEETEELVITEELDSLDVQDNNEWTKNVREMLEDLIREFELPERSLYMTNNKSEKTKELISHSVCIWEPDYPSMPNEDRTQNKVVTNIVISKAKIERPDDLDLTIREAQVKDLLEYLPEDAEIMQQTLNDQNTGMVRVRIKRTSQNLTEYIRQNTIYCIERYESKATKFGCCRFFEKCSDLKKCIHVNKLYSKACMYRRNMEQGQIFFGKNRNIL